MAKRSSTRRSPSDARRGRASRAGASGLPTGQPPSHERPSTELGATRPGAFRIVACLGDEAPESTDIGDLAGFMATPDRRIWVDLESPDDAQVKAAADALGLHPLIAEDIRER